MTKQNVPAGVSYVMTAAQDDQLPAVHTYSSEPIENACRAVRGIVEGPKQIAALFYLPTDCSSLTDDAQVTLCIYR